MPRTSVLIPGFIVTTDPIPKYNGHSFRPEVMFDIAQKIRERNIPLGIEHDRKQRLNYEIRLVEVRKTETGALGVWVELKMDREEWKKIENKRAFSVSIEEIFHYPDPADTKPKLAIAIDPAHFDEETIQSVTKELEQYFAVEASYLYQLSDNITLVGAVLNIAQGAVGNLLATGICVAIQKLFAKLKGNQEGRSQVSEFIIEKGNQKITLKTGDSRLVKSELDKLIPRGRSYRKRKGHKQIAPMSHKRKKTH